MQGLAFIIGSGKFVDAGCRERVSTRHWHAYTPCSSTDFSSQATSHRSIRTCKLTAADAQVFGVDATVTSVFGHVHVCHSTAG